MRLNILLVHLNNCSRARGSRPEHVRRAAAMQRTLIPAVLSAIVFAQHRFTNVQSDQTPVLRSIQGQRITSALLCNRGTQR